MTGKDSNTANAILMEKNLRSMFSKNSQIFQKLLIDRFCKELKAFWFNSNKKQILQQEMDIANKERDMALEALKEFQKKNMMN